MEHQTVKQNCCLNYFGILFSRLDYDYVLKGIIFLLEKLTCEQCTPQTINDYDHQAEQDVQQVDTGYRLEGPIWPDAAVFIKHKNQ